MRSTLCGLAVAGAALTLAVAPMSDAHAAPGGESGWEPIATAPFTLAAGAVCTFEVQVGVLYDSEMARVAETNPDGSVRVQEFKGALGLRFTNAATGESADRDASGTLVFTFHDDGSIDSNFRGNGLAVISARNAIDEPGAFVISGNADLVRHPDGKSEFVDVDGTVENMCQTLS